MTNEQLKKLENYSYQLSTFALTMQDDAMVMEQLKWQKYALKVLEVSSEMDKEIAQEKYNKIHVVL
jgi:hypothetical protein